MLPILFTLMFAAGIFLVLWRAFGLREVFAGLVRDEEAELTRELAKEEELLASLGAAGGSPSADLLRRHCRERIAALRHRLGRVRAESAPPGVEPPGETVH